MLRVLLILAILVVIVIGVCIYFAYKQALDNDTNARALQIAKAGLLEIQNSQYPQLVADETLLKIKKEES
jgi:hypothetical protein